MKNCLISFFLILMLGLLGTVPEAKAEVSIGVEISTYEDFYAPLEPSGVWVEVGSYGRCWRPRSVARDWRPYSDGVWVWTDCGWYWESDEPWSWACYHYGSWVHDPGHGWVWIPDVEWAPAWVSWRVGGGHIGWAPRAPRDVVIAPSFFVFVESRRFPEHHRSSTLIVNNTTIINNTTEIRNVRRESRNFGGSQKNVVINEGPGVQEVEKATGKKLAAASVVAMDQKTKEKAPPEVKVKKAKSPKVQAKEPQTETSPLNAPSKVQPSSEPAKEQPLKESKEQGPEKKAKEKEKEQPTDSPTFKEEKSPNTQPPQEKPSQDPKDQPSKEPKDQPSKGKDKRPKDEPSKEKDQEPRDQAPQSPPFGPVPQDEKNSGKDKK